MGYTLLMERQILMERRNSTARKGALIWALDMATLMLEMRTAKVSLDRTASRAASRRPKNGPCGATMRPKAREALQGRVVVLLSRLTRMVPLCRGHRPCRRVPAALLPSDLRLPPPLRTSIVQQHRAFHCRYRVRFLRQDQHRRRRERPKRKHAKLSRRLARFSDPHHAGLGGTLDVLGTAPNVA